MPIPFVFAAIKAAALGIGKRDTNESGEIQQIVCCASENIRRSTENSSRAMADLDRKRVWILENSIEPFIALCGQLRGTGLEPGLDRLKEFLTQQRESDHFRQRGEAALSAARAAAHQTIASLAKAEKYRTEVDSIQRRCKAIRMRTNALERILIQLDAVFTPQIDAIARLIQTRGPHFSQYSKAERAVVFTGMSLAEAVKDVLDTPVFSENGDLTRESETVIAAAQAVLSHYQV